MCMVQNTKKSLAYQPLSHFFPIAIVIFFSVLTKIKSMGFIECIFIYGFSNKSQ